MGPLQCDPRDARSPVAQQRQSEDDRGRHRGRCSKLYPHAAAQNEDSGHCARECHERGSPSARRIVREAFGLIAAGRGRNNFAAADRQPSTGELVRVLRACPRPGEHQLVHRSVFSDRRLDPRRQRTRRLAGGNYERAVLRSAPHEAATRVHRVLRHGFR